MARIFIVEDNENLREVVSSYLKLNKHAVVEFSGIKGLMKAVESQEPDLIVLDVMLPDGNGFLFARDLRQKYETPILFLTAKSSESDRITGFELGGDDYVVKPFSPKELVLRVEAILKRSKKNAPDETEIMKWLLDDSELTIDYKGHRVTIDGNEVNLTPAEWNILHFLAVNARMVISRGKLLSNCLDYMNVDFSERTIDTHIKNIRSKLKNPKWISTIRSFGYRFEGKNQ